MKLIHHAVEIGEMPDEWWVAANMTDFTPQQASYTVDATGSGGQAVFEIRFEDVAPVERRDGVAIFNDDRDTGTPARDRVVRILEGFRSRSAIPPVQVVLLPAGSPHIYKLTAGAHRFYCSMAAGFSAVPAVQGFDWAWLDA